MRRWHPAETSQTDLDCQQFTVEYAELLSMANARVAERADRNPQYTTVYSWAEKDGNGGVRIVVRLTP